MIVCVHVYVCVTAWQMVAHICLIALAAKGLILLNFILNCLIIDLDFDGFSYTPNDIQNYIVFFSFMKKVMFFCNRLNHLYWHTFARIDIMPDQIIMMSDCVSPALF